MSIVLEETTVAELVRDNFKRADVFKKFGIDFCCGGNKSLQQVCDEKDIDLDDLVKNLEEVLAAKKDTHDYDSWKLDFLADYIINTHHTYVKEAIPILEQYVNKVVKVHGNANPELHDILKHFSLVAAELSQHMMKEEQMLFPYIKDLTQGNENAKHCPFGTIENPINMMLMEHESAGDNMKAIRTLSNDFTPPEHACNTYRVLFAKLEEFEEDLHTHIHLENNILFPKAIALEKEVS